MTTFISILDMFKLAIGQIFTALSITSIFGYSVLSIIVTGFVITLLFNMFARLGGASVGGLTDKVRSKAEKENFKR